MIYAPLSYAVRSTEYPVAAGATISSNGQALVVSNVGNVFGVAPSSGAVGEVFVGFVNAQVSAAPFLESTAVKVETAVVNGAGTVTLAFTPLSTTTLIYNNTTDAVIAQPPGVITGKVVSALPVGNTVTVTYTYALTVSQAVALMGNQQPGGSAGAMTGSIGVGQQGRIYTTAFVSGKNYAAATSLKLAANGQITDQTGSGVAINGFVTQVPTLDVPFLGIEYLAA